VTASTVSRTPTPTSSLIAAGTSTKKAGNEISRLMISAPAATRIAARLPLRQAMITATSPMTFGPGIAGLVLDYFAAPPVPVAEPFPELTAREREILDLLASGRRTAAIAERLFLSPKTVSNHLTNVFAKLEVADRTEAIIRAREGGLGLPP